MPAPYSASHKREETTMKSTNIPEVKLGIIAVSRDCFPIALSEKRRAAIAAACQTRGVALYECMPGKDGY